MLPIATIQEIDRLLKDGQLSQRKIAKQLGVSRGTVQAIAVGRRGLYGRDPDEDAPNTLTPASPPARCPKCGFLVYLPCLVCRTRDYRAHRQWLRSEEVLPNSAEPLRMPDPTLAVVGRESARVA